MPTLIYGHMLWVVTERIRLLSKVAFPLQCGGGAAPGGAVGEGGLGPTA